MDNKNNFSGAETLLNNIDLAILQKGIFIGENAPSKVKTFCNSLWIRDYDYALLTSSGYLYKDIARTACLLALIAAKAQPCYEFNIYGYNLTFYESGTRRNSCYILADGVPQIQISENFDEGGWDILNINPNAIGDDTLLDALLIASYELAQ